ncbi:MAG TPA: hypothetical protein VGO11_12700 [Chthoniobacteraceae bacterium]|jgi:hypothetical protein|nr:hypothetical protein [Chthoniobacteraceae bacterium]
MSTLAEIEAALPRLPEQELTRLEQTIRDLKRRRDTRPRKSLRDRVRVSAGKMLKPLGPDDDILGEMLDAKFGDGPIDTRKPS